MPPLERQPPTPRAGSTRCRWLAAAALLVLGAWTAATAQPDLTLACIQTSPPDPAFFADGQTVTLECDVTNQGSSSTGRTVGLVSVFSLDAAVDASDTLIASLAAVPVLAGGESTHQTLSGAPLFNVVGPRWICTKIDAVAGNLTGVVPESDETNNEICTRVEVVEAKKDLVVAPGSVALAPDPRDPNAFRAGLQLEISYGSLNQGIGGIRRSYTNFVHLGTTEAGALADPNGPLCRAGIAFSGQSQFQAGGTEVPVTHGLGDASDPGTCRIPFGLPEGDYVVVVQVDAEDDVNERAATGDVRAAEMNNTLAVPVHIDEPLDPEFRIQHDPGIPGDQLVEVTGPATETMLISVSSARGLAGYSLTLLWDPPDLLSIGDPSLPSGDPGQVSFSGLLESGGLAQSCSVTAIDPAAGSLQVACTTSNPGGAGTAADAEKVTPLLSVILTPVLPGGGDLRIQDLTAVRASGQPFTAPRERNGTFIVGGPPDVAVAAPALPPEVFPGLAFAADYELINDGFGNAVPPLIMDLLVARDPNRNPLGAASAPVRACSQAESSALAAKSSVLRTVSGCGLFQDLRPGYYTGAFVLRDDPDPGSGAAAGLALPARITALRQGKKGRSLEVLRAPDGPGGTTGPPMARAAREKARSLAAVRSVSRNLNWLAGVVRPRRGPRKARLLALPQGESRRLRVLSEVRLPGEDKTVLGAADIDGDGEDELILLTRAGGSGDALDFRRIDFTERKPLICQSAAVTDPLPRGIVAATGIQLDGDPPDEIAVVDREGGLTIHDVAFSGSLPPASPCRPVPTLLEEPALALLTPVAGDPAFAGQGELLSLCALDYGLDGVEELAGLHQGEGRVQALRIHEPPQGIGGMVVTVAEDEEFGGVGGKPRARDIACTR